MYAEIECQDIMVLNANHAEETLLIEKFVGNLECEMMEYMVEEIDFVKIQGLSHLYIVNQYRMK
jgi:hypothetical protein